MTTFAPDTALVWFRRDLRLADNPALRHAVDHHRHVIPVFIQAPDEEAPWSPGGASQWWLHHALTALVKRTAELGSPMIIRTGNSLTTLRMLVKESGATAVYWNRLYEPALIARDQLIKQTLRAEGVAAKSFNSALLFEPWELQTGSGGPYRVFSPFWRKATERLRVELDGSRSVQDQPSQLAAPAKAPKSLTVDALKLLPTIPWDLGLQKIWTPGEQGAQQRARQFFKSTVGEYRQQRDLPGVAATSSLSPHLHHGEISPLQLVLMAREFERTAQTGGIANAEWYVRELGWREFSHHLIYHYPNTPATPLYERFAAFPWRAKTDYAADLQAWQQGRTGIPIVDAGMRQLWATGWMHNRVRMIVASFLTKNLLIPWQEGAAWFWDTLVDASLPQNSLGWQWAAGCGADAAPYFRIFNPVLQGEKFDADGAYTRHWLPELAKLPDKFLHQPWNAPANIRSYAGISTDSPYATPVVELAKSRDRALAAYAEIKG